MWVMHDKPIIIQPFGVERFFVLSWTGEKFDWAECFDYETAVSLIEADMDSKKMEIE